MSKAKLTLIGLNQWMHNIGDDLFGDLQLPTGINKDTFVDSLLLECGEFEVMYPDADFLKEAIGKWGNKWQRTFKKWFDALSLEYDPIYNYDRMEDWTDTVTGGNTVTSKGNSKSNNKSKVSAFDSGTMQPDGETDVSVNNDDTATSEMNTTTTHKASIKGNIGVTTSQQMLQSELEIAEWNLFAKMCDIFANEFLIQVY